MKTKDMIRDAEIYCSYLNDKSALKSNKYRVEVNDEEILIRNEAKIGFLRAWVSRKLTNTYEFHMFSTVEYDEYHTQGFIRSLIDYSETPLKEREDEKRWRIYIPYDSTVKYLYLDKNEKTYRFLYYRFSEDRDYKAEFTRSEIEDWAGTNSDEIVDWIIGKFGEEVN